MATYPYFPTRYFPLQEAQPFTLPDAKYVYKDVDRGDGTVGLLNASNISNAKGSGDNLAAVDLRLGKNVDDIVGSLDPEGGGTYKGIIFEAETGEPFLFLNNKFITRLIGE
jgi:hypothetical protein